MAPTSKAQPSRKGKKAWRKNVDVEDIHAGLEAKREKEVLQGTDDDFVIDNEGDNRKTHGSKLKSREILENKSKVPALVSRQVKHKVSKKQAKQLMALAGRLNTDSKLKTRLDKDGIIRGKNVDVWADEEEVAQPDSYKKSAFKAYMPATKAPKTMAHAPLALTVSTTEVGLVHAGKSYNPELGSWKDLIDREFNAELSLEMKRQAMEEHQKRIQHLIETLDDKEIDTSGDEAPEEEEEAAEDEDEETKYKLSINERTELKIKTKTKRNKEAAHKKRMELQAKLTNLKKQINDLLKLEDIQKEVEVKESQIKKKAPKKYFRHGKSDVTFKPIEVKLSDELTNSMRSVKPEGNLFYDHMHKLQASGQIEARVPVVKKRKYARKFTEKWSYKNFK